MNYQLNGLRAVVCGSSGGIGLAIAEEFARQGATCLLLARNKEKLAAAVNKLPPVENGRHEYIAADFKQTEKLQQLADELLAGNRFHILVNNSGGPPPGDAIDAGTNDFLSAFQQHLIANHILTKALVKGMRELHYGRIINIISTSVKIPIKGLGVSNTVRGAVASWAKTLSAELAPDGITVNNILPGLTQTDRLVSLIQNKVEATGLSEQEVTGNMIAEIPAGRFAGAHEPAALAAFLASPAAAYITGVSIQVDGGKTGAL